MKLFSKKKSSSKGESGADDAGTRNQFMLNRITFSLIDALSIASHGLREGQQPLDGDLAFGAAWSSDDFRAFNAVIRGYVEHMCNVLTNGGTDVPRMAQVKRQLPYGSTREIRDELRRVAFEFDRFANPAHMANLRAFLADQRSVAVDQVSEADVVDHIVGCSHDRKSAVGYLERCFDDAAQTGPGAKPGATSLANRPNRDYFLMYCRQTLPDSHPYWQVNRLRPADGDTSTASTSQAAPAPAAGQPVPQYSAPPRMLMQDDGNYDQIGTPSV